MLINKFDSWPFTCIVVNNTGSVDFKHHFGFGSAVRWLAWQHKVRSFSDIQVEITSVFKPPYNWNANREFKAYASVWF